MRSMSPAVLVSPWDSAKTFWDSSLEMAVFKIKARLWAHYGLGELRIIKKTAKSFVIAKTYVLHNDTTDATWWLRPQ